MKKGIALLITIGFLLILMSLIGYMLTISQNNFDKIEKIKLRNQSTIIFSDVKKILDSYAKEVKDSEDLDLFLAGLPPFYNDKSRFSLYVQIKPLSNKININSILIKNKTDKNIESFIKNICETYNILDPSFLVALILDTIDTDVVSRQALSEISQEDIKFSNSKIINMKHFEKIVDYYIKITQDSNIKNVPWSRLIYFGKIEKSILDCDRLSKELINVLRLQVDEFAGCESLEDKYSKKIAKNYELKSYSKKDSYFVKVEVQYSVEDEENSVIFDYDMKTNKATNIKNKL